MKYFVEIVEAATVDSPSNVVKRMGPLGEREAEKVERGVLINLNYERFFVRIVTEVA